MIGLWLFTLVSGTPLTAQTKTETFTLSQEEKAELEACDYALEACGGALKQAGKVIQSKNGIIDLKADQIKALAGQNARLKAERDSLWRNPLVWFLGGIVAGGLTYGLIQRI